MMRSDMTNEAKVAADPSHDIFRSERQPLDFIFRPASVAVIGATDRQGSVGRTVLENLLRGSWSNSTYPVNPRHNEILGVRCYPTIGDIPGRVDFAVVVTPAVTVPGVIRDCVTAGVKGAVIISAGFKETGTEGARLETKILGEARRGRLRLIGPNCLGIMNPTIGLNATFAQKMALPGNVAFLSQSGALCTAILDWSQREAVGFSAFVSTGSMLDVGWGDLIYYFGDDYRTRSILIYMESIGDARSFLSAAREVARTKPIIVIKAGRTEAAAKAAASHTGAMTGSDEVLDAAFRRCGVLRVNRIAELFEMADVLSKQPRPRGPRLAIVTNAGGAGVLATDALLRAGGELATLSPRTIQELEAILPSHWSHANPVDILGDANADRYSKALDVTLEDPESDGFLAILAPQGMTSPTEVARQIASRSERPRAPILAAWMGGDTVAEGARLLSRAGIPAFAFPDEAARAFTYLWQYSANLQALNETPTFVTGEPSHLEVARASDILREVRSRNRTLLTEWESKQVLVAYGIPTVRTEIAKNPHEAVSIADRIGYPVVVKLHSESISHKTDVGGVALNLRTPEAVRGAFEQIQRVVSQRKGEGHFLGATVQPMIRLHGYELILGCSLDPQFGPILLFGAGGELVEIWHDRVLGLPPLTTTLARRMMERTRIYRALQGIRGRRAVDLNALESVLVRFGQLVAEQRWIKEIDINPLLVSEDQIIALDARVVVHGRATDESQIPRLAIRPYPAQYISTYRLRNESLVRIRPIRPEDEPAMVQFHKKLSDSTVYMRYLGFMKLEQRTAHERLTRICFIDYDREMVLVAEQPVSASADGEILGVGRLSKFHGSNEAEFAVLIRDDFQRQGLGTELLRQLLAVARNEKLDRVFAVMAAENTAMRKMAERAGFRLDAPDGEHLVTGVLKLSEMQDATCG
jgi:acetyltransferase